MPGLEPSAGAPVMTHLDSWTSGGALPCWREPPGPGEPGLRPHHAWLSPPRQATDISDTSAQVFQPVTQKSLQLQLEEGFCALTLGVAWIPFRDWTLATAHGEGTNSSGW